MYIWGHLFIVVGALYAVLLKVVRIDFKSFLYGVLTVFLIMIPAIILNSYYNDVLGYSINYFFIYDTNGFPLEFLYIGERSQYGWFTINRWYTVFMIVIFGALMYGIYNIQKLLYLKDKDYKTYHVFSKRKMLEKSSPSQ